MKLFLVIDLTSTYNRVSHEEFLRKKCFLLIGKFSHIALLQMLTKAIKMPIIRGVSTIYRVCLKSVATPSFKESISLIGNLFGNNSESDIFSALS